MPNIINVSNGVQAPVDYFGYLVFVHNAEDTNRASRVFDSKVGDVNMPIMYRMTCGYYAGSTAGEIWLQGTNAEDSADEPSTTTADWVTIDTVTAASVNRVRNDDTTAEKTTSGYRYYRFNHRAGNAKCVSFGVIGFASE